MDEPLNGLNKKLREKVNLILENYAQRSLVIVITHQKDEICSKSGIINFVDGKAIKIKENQIVEKKRLAIPKVTKATIIVSIVHIVLNLL